MLYHGSLPVWLLLYLALACLDLQPLQLKKDKRKLASVKWLGQR
ncbi:MAG: hypothetical protein AVDCRST_MAG96-687 [uncultured Segetibacter sp.]|uniref:Uncharacterized protein n=1 Tax=uncultured Segetibacter sp. TaxID=481133 RepID=A0A6J4RNU5_9BACT|nr:MAG: hypothetical protein AVDCRST_MAG96-687 [uncultured Segetibacter sp.]